MKHFIYITLPVVFFAAQTAVAGPGTYDNFDNGFDAAKWDMRFTGSPQNFVREVSDGNLRLKVRGVGGTTSNSGQTVTRNGIDLPDSLVATTQVLETVLIVDKARVRGCATDGASDTKVRFMQFLTPFNAAGNTTSGDFTGEIFVTIAIEKSDTDTLSKDRLSITAFFERCENTSCSSITDLTPVDNPATPEDEGFNSSLGKIRWGERVSIRAVHDATAQQIRYRAKRQGKPAKERSIDYATIVTNAGPPAGQQFLQSIQTRTDVANCDLSAGDIKEPYGQIDVRIMKVKRAETADGS